jgi:hypothetical protein
MALRCGSGLRAISLHPVRYLALVVLYLFVAHLVVEPETVGVAITDLVVAGTGLAFIGTLLTAARPRDLVLAFVLIHAALAASDLVLVAARFAGLEQALRLAAFPLKTYIYTVQWNAPLAFTYDQPVPVGGLMLPRAIGLYREPGVYQAFALTAATAALMLRDLPWRRSLATLIVLGSACSLSTAWLASLAATAAWAVLARVDRRSAASLAGVAVLLALLAGGLLAASLIPGLGFSDKLGDESGQDRLRAFAALGPAFTASPWLGLGQGTQWSQDAIVSVSGSFIVGMARLGVVGTALFLSATAATLLGRHDRRSLTLLVPLATTMLTSQPLYYSVGAYFLLALPWREALTPPAVVPLRLPARPRVKALAVPEEEIEPLEPHDAVPADEELVITDDEDDDEDADGSLIPVVIDEDELDDDAAVVIASDDLDDDDEVAVVITDEPDAVGTGR